jgi:uncharacterized protein (DUF305 family)
MTHQQYHRRNIRRASIARFVSLIVLGAVSSVACGDDNDATDATTDNTGGRSSTTGSANGSMPGTASTAGTSTTPGMEAGGSTSSSPGRTGSTAAGADGATAAAGASAGGTSGVATANRTSADIVGDRRVPFSPENDREFAQFFIEHHQMAIDMANEEVERGGNAEVQALAQRIVDKQTQELDTLQAAVTAIGSTQPAPPNTPEDPHTTADMHYMAGLSGVELDKMFLLDMIPHHAAGLPPAHRAEPRLQRTELKTMATGIFEDQASEIGEMRTLLEQLGVDEAGEDRAAAIPDRADFGLEGDRRVPLTPASDLEFLDFFISHHEMAIQMAEHEVDRGENAEVIALAESVRTQQIEELETMRGIRTDVGGSAEPAPMPPDPHADPEMVQMMNASGTELDRMFLTEMIPHHAAGLPPAHRATPHVQTEQLRTMATDIYQAQAEEIGAMKALLDALGQ